MYHIPYSKKRPIVLNAAISPQITPLGYTGAKVWDTSIEKKIEVPLFPRFQSYSHIMIGVYNHLLNKVFRFHYHSQKVIGSLGIVASWGTWKTGWWLNQPI